MKSGSGLRDFLTALGLMLVFEGMLYAAAPAFMKGVLERMREISDNAFRVGGLAALVAGVALVWFVRG